MTGSGRGKHMVSITCQVATDQPCWHSRLHSNSQIRNPDLQASATTPSSAAVVLTSKLTFYYPLKQIWPLIKIDKVDKELPEVNGVSSSTGNNLKLLLGLKLE